MTTERHARRPRLFRTAARDGTRALVLGLVLTGCGRGGGQGPQPVSTVWTTIEPNQVLYADNSGGIQDSVLAVVRTADSLTVVIGRAAARQTAPPQFTPVDFDNEMVLLAAMGRMTPNDRVWIDSIGFGRELTIDRKLEDVVKVAVRLIEACRRGGSPAYPLQIVRVPRSDATVKWVQTRQRDPDCSDPAGAADGVKPARRDRTLSQGAAIRTETAR